MNPLAQHIDARNLRPERILNILQENGVISDLCVTAEDVAEVDCERAIEWLNTEWKPK